MNLDSIIAGKIDFFSDEPVPDYSLPLKVVERHYHSALTRTSRMVP